ncbi:MAG: glycosyltransferase family 2 protein [Eubacterium ventriosum]|nr:glycosyltransferase family 2 protein [Eubacterium ventriosum]
MKFSVVVPIYNVEKYLNKCVESILDQTYKDFELILVDDGSPDHCPEICDEYAERDARVRVIHKENEGLVAARNTGIKEAKGEYICYVDGDDWIANNLLETVWKKALKNYDVEIVVYSAIKQFEKHQEEIPKAVSEGLYNKEKLKKEIYPYMMYDSRKPFCTGLIFPVAWNKIFKREFLLKHYCKEEKIRMGEDNAFVFECIYEADNIYFCEDKLYFYNQLNVSSMVHSYDERRFDNNKLLTNYMEERLKGKDKVLDEQMNAFKAYWLIMAIFHEVKCGKSINYSRKHINQKIKETKALKGIRTNELPNSAKMYLILLKMHLYMIALIGAKVISKRRG